MLLVKLYTTYVKSYIIVVGTLFCVGAGIKFVDSLIGYAYYLQEQKRQKERKWYQFWKYVG